MKLIFLLIFLINSLHCFNTTCFKNCQCNEKVLNCSSNKLTNLFDQIEYFNYSVIELQHNYIKMLNKVKTNIKFIVLKFNLGFNKIEQIDSNFFINFDIIEHIYLNHNKLNYINENQFKNLQKLKYLNLEFNEIKFLGVNCFKNLYSIEKINLFNNHLESFKQEVGLINNIVKFKLNLISNPLKCDCNFNWLLEKVKINQVALAAFCNTPLNLKNLTLNELLLPHLQICFNQPIDLIKKKQISNEKEFSLNVIIGDKIILSCFNKEKKISWFKGNIKISSNEKTLIENENSLRIFNFNYNDEDTYSCKLNNEVLKIFHLKGAEPPIFTILPNELYELNLGENLTLNCEAHGKPYPQISWIFKTLNTNLTSGNSIVFNNVTSDIDGSYQCVASNQFGFAIKDFTIKIKGGNIHDKPSIYGLGSRANNIVAFVSDEDIENAVINAKQAVEEAINKTISIVKSKKNFEFPIIIYKDQPFFSTGLTEKKEKEIKFKFINKTKSFSPSRLMKIGMFPLDLETIKSAKTYEVYQKSLELLKRKAEMSEKFMALNFTFTDILTTNQLTILNSLTGCLPGNKFHNFLNHKPCNLTSEKTNLYRTFDGSCNNLKNPLQGTALTTFKRLLHPIYEDGLHLPVGWLENKLYNGFKLPNPRKVTLDILKSDNTINDMNNTAFLMHWGQFLDHDLSLSLPSVSFSTFDRQKSVDCQTTCSKTPPCYSIPLEKNDPRKTRKHLSSNRNISYSNCIEFIRSSSFCGSGLSSISLGILMPREQVNQLTSYLDASQIYGSSSQLAFELIDHSDEFGRLKTSLIKNKEFLPLNYGNRLPNDCQQEPEKSFNDCFLAGDIRSNEQIGLTALHTLFLREHNRLAKTLKRINKHWIASKTFHEARNILISKIQFITYEHWLKYVLGPEEHKKFINYSGYKENIDSSISNVFSASAFRFGHTLIQPYLMRLDENFSPTKKIKSKLSLYETFFSPHLIIEEGLDPILRSLFYNQMKKPEPENVINFHLTENLFELARHISLDLASINIQRGRDHGIPSYNEWRKFCNLTYAKTFDDFSTEIKNQNLIKKLKELYGHPSNVDLWVGSVLENQIQNSKIGPTFACLIKEQFERTRSGDRFWYEKIWSKEKLDEIKKTSLAEIICLNSDNIKLINPNVFVWENNLKLVNCSSIQQTNLQVWSENKEN